MGTTSNFLLRCKTSAALKKMGVPVIKKVKKKSLKKIENWIDDGRRLDISFPDIAADAVARLMEKAE